MGLNYDLGFKVEDCIKNCIENIRQVRIYEEGSE